MKKRNLLIGLFTLLFGVGVYAGCPVVDCGADCGSGSVCSITQYVNGQQCSWTICYGVGPSDNY